MATALVAVLVATAPVAALMATVLVAHGYIQRSGVRGPNGAIKNF